MKVCSIRANQEKLWPFPSMMMLEQPLAILEEIPHDHDIQPQDDAQYPEIRMRPQTTFRQRMTMDQFENFDRNEKRRFTNRQPIRPWPAKDQPDALRQRNKAIEKRSGRHQAHVPRRNFVQFVADIG